jgi:hypothetical protein
MNRASLGFSLRGTREESPSALERIADTPTRYRIIETALR